MHLVKLDSETMQPLVNATFLIEKVGGTFSKEYTTDRNGEIDLSKLEPGAYTVTETKAPDGYLIDNAVRTIQLNEGENAMFVFTDTKKPSLTVVKYDPVADKYLAGATFRIAKIEDGSHYLDRVTDVNGRITIFRSTASFKDFQRPEYALKHFIRFVLAKTAITYALDIMTGIFSICGGVVSTIGSSMGGMTQVAATLPTEITTAIEDIGFFASIPLWLVTLLGSLFIFVLSIILILTVYGRFFKLYLYTALAPVPLASFAGEGTNSIGKAFVKSYTGVCMEGAVIILACIIFTAFASTSAPVIDTATSTVTMVWKYIGEIIFNMLVLVGLVKASDRIVREMLGL